MTNKYYFDTIEVPVSARDEGGGSSLPAGASIHSHKTPVIKRNRYQPWINYGLNNSYPDYLLYLYDNSPTHAAIINKKAHYIYGKGFEVKCENPGLKTQAEACLKKWKKTLKPAVLDREIFEGMALKIVQHPLTFRPIKVEHIPWRELRINEDATEIYHSKMWTYEQSIEYVQFAGINRRPLDLQCFAPYGTPGAVVTILYKRFYSPQMKVYPSPVYDGAKAAIENEIEILNYDLNNTRTGFSAGTMLTFTNGVPEEDEQKQISKQVKRKLSGTDNAGEIIISFTDNEKQVPKVDQLRPNEMADQFEQLDPRNKQSIYTGHQVTSPMLFGDRQDGQLGGRKELKDAYDLFYSDYAGPRAAEIAEVFEGLVKIIVPGEYTLELTQNPPFSEDYFEQILPHGIAGIPAQLLAEIIAERIGIDPARLPKPQPVAVPQQFSADDRLYSRFEAIGESAENYEFFIHKSVTDKVRSDFDTWENQMSAMYSFARHQFDDKTTDGLNDKDKEALDIVLEDKEIPLDKLAKSLDVSNDKAIEILNKLMGKNLIAYTTSETAGKITINREIVAKQIPAGTSVVVRYRYWGPYDVKTRPFCKKMLEADKVYTRAELEGLKNDAGLSVWDTRGGWYTDPDTGITRNNCRHIFQLMVGRKKNGG